MWAYRIRNSYANTQFTRPLSLIKQATIGSAVPLTNEFPLDNWSTISIAWKQSQELWLKLKWDGSISGEPRVFLVPGAAGFNLGFMVTSLDQVTFLSSPFALPHLEQSLDYDACINLEELDRARKIILEGEAPKNVIHWKRSRKGNLTAEHQFSVITVFPSDDGFKAVISFGHMKQFTPKQPTEAAACKYVIERYDQLRRELTAKPIDPDDPWSDY